MIKYYDLGSNKQLNRIVMAGSHDAGMNRGANNVKTQSLDIYNQAKSGVRIFDIRITGKPFEWLTAFHTRDSPCR